MAEALSRVVSDPHRRLNYEFATDSCTTGGSWAALIPVWTLIRNTRRPRHLLMEGSTSDRVEHSRSEGLRYNTAFNERRVEPRQIVEAYRLATMFLDREPYIHIWRPVYRVLGPAIRPVKAAALRVGRPFFGSVSDGQLCRIENQIAKLEASQQQFHSAIEQILLAALADRQLMNSLSGIEERVRCTVTEEQMNKGLAELQNQLMASNTQWSAIESLVITFMAGSLRGVGGSIEAIEPAAPAISASASRRATG